MANDKRITSLSFLLMLLFGFALAIISPLLPKIASVFDLSLSETGRIFAFNFFGFVVFILLSGILVDKFGKKKILVVDIVGMGISLILFGFSWNFTIMLFFVFFLGGFGGVLETTVSSLLVDQNPNKEAYFVNASQVFFGVGAVGGPLLAGLFIGRGEAWRWFYFVSGVIFIACAFILLNTKVREKEIVNAVNWRNIKKLVAAPGFLLFCLCMFCYSGAEVGSWGWMSTFIATKSGFSGAIASLSVAVFWGAILAGRLISLPLIKRINEKKLVIVMAALAVVALILSALVNSPFLIWIAVILMGLGYSAQWPVILATGTKDHENTGTAAAILVASSGVGMMVVPFVLGYIAELFGIRWAIAAPAVLMVVIGLSFIYFLRKEPKNEIIVE